MRLAGPAERAAVQGALILCYRGDPKAVGTDGAASTRALALRCGEATGDACDRIGISRFARSLACSHGRFAAAGVCVRTSSAWAFLLRLFPFLSLVAIDWKVWAAAAQKEIIMLQVPHGWKRFR